MAWRVAKSLDQLLRQLNEAFPKRSKVSDGSIGDAAHASRTSDHNPWYGPGIVTARDFTHDPANGLDCQKLADALVKARDPRIKYIIWNRRIIDSRAGSNPWKWMPYNGTNPHTKHLHLSVMDNSSCDSTAAWALPGLAAPAPQPPPTKTTTTPQESDLLTAEEHAMLLETRDLLRWLWSQVAGEGAKPFEFTGWPGFPGGAGKKLTLVDYMRQNDVEVQALKRQLAEIKAKLDAV
jgi:hypothetical protein